MSKRDLLITLLRESVDKCYQRDFTLVDRGMEQACVARIYYYMQEALEKNKRFMSLSQYNLDSEYYKNGQSPKRTPRFKCGTRPDIILHCRLDEPQQNNMLVLEFKSKLTAGGDKIPQRDKEKLEDFTHDECGYNYCLGVFIRLNSDHAEYRFFQRSCEKSESELCDD